jgi:glutamine cyclotransferase
VLGEVYLSKIDLNALTAGNFVNLGGENWGVSFDSPMLIKENNSDYLVFQGRTFSKKAKDSELVFAKVKK